MKRLLLIDNSDTNTKIIKTILKKNNYDIITVGNTEKVFSIFETGEINLILMGIEHIRDLDLVIKIKKNLKIKNIPLIILSSDTENLVIKEAFEFGADDYISKPFNEIELLSRIKRQLQNNIEKNQLEKNLFHNTALLKQYKDVVDQSSIVSKTDKRGRITYANEAFVKISGYSLDELIGKPHNIVRHPDMPKDAFKEMWKTLKEKRTWRGAVKNLNKNGHSYVVESTVMPITDSTGEIQELISVRYDITDLCNLQEEIVNTQKEVVFIMGSIGETRSKETGNHVKRVAEYSRLFGNYSGLEENQVELLVQASPMHDIGKVGIPDNILHKPGKLTDDEFFIMRTHSELGYKMLCHSTRPLLKLAATIAIEHHERWDGRGYPKHLKENEISIEGRITAIADVFDALGSDRVYKEKWEDEKIFDLFKEERGKQFDPQLVDIFFNHLDEFLEIRRRFKDIA